MGGNLQYTNVITMMTITINNLLNKDMAKHSLHSLYTTPIQQCFYANSILNEHKKHIFELWTIIFLSCMRVMDHNWSAKKQHLHLQSVARTSHYSALLEDSIWQCGTSSGSRHKDTDQCLQVAISFCRHRSVPVPCENGSVATTVAEEGQNPIARLWGHTLDENWPVTTWADFQLCLYRVLMSIGCKSSHSGFLNISHSSGGLRISGCIGQLSCLTIFSTSFQWQPSYVQLAVQCWRALKATGERYRMEGARNEMHGRVQLHIDQTCVSRAWPDWVAVLCCWVAKHQSR